MDDQARNEDDDNRITRGLATAIDLIVQVLVIGLLCRCGKLLLILLGASICSPVVSRKSEKAKKRLMKGEMSLYSKWEGRPM